MTSAPAEPNPRPPAPANWSNTPLKLRLAVVRRFRGLLAERAEAIARRVAEASASRPSGGAGMAEVLTSEVLPLCDAAKFLERRAGALLKPRRLGVRSRPAWLVGVSAEIRRAPLGTVLILAAGNYPWFLPGVQALQALAAGNVVVLKPGRGGTAAAEALAELLHEAGLPAGCLAVTGESVEDATAALDASSGVSGGSGGGVDKVFLTGSVASGRAVLARCAETLTPACVELSGCDAVFVLPPEDEAGDAHVVLAARAVAFGLRLNGSQTCIAPRRVFVPPEVKVALVEALKREVDAGGPVAWDAGVVERTWPSVEAAVAGGASMVCGGKPTGDADRLVGLPVVLAGVTSEMDLPQRDVFGPVVSVMEAADEDAMLAADAACPYALGASVFGPRKLAERFAKRVRAGSVTVNDLIAPTADPRLPFGGRGDSGFGVTRGAEGLLEMTRVKTVSVRPGWAVRWVGHPHYDPVGEEDAAAFAAYLRTVHGAGLASRLAALPELMRGLKALSKKQKQD